MKPTQEQVTEWSSEAGLYASRQTDDKFDWKVIYALQFATLAYEAGRAAENEACAKLADVGADGEDPFCCRPVANGIAAAIRARMNPLQRMNDAAEANGEEL